MSRRFAVSHAGTAAEELTGSCLPTTSPREGQGFAQQKRILKRVSRAFHVLSLIRKFFSFIFILFSELSRIYGENLGAG